MLLSFALHAQYVQISGVINDYYPVVDVDPAYVQCTPGTDLSSLVPGDKVVLVQMTGVQVNASNILANISDPQNYANTGKYELLAVRSVDDGTDQVTFTVTLDDSRYTAGEKIQLVKIFEADYAEVTGTLSAADWDGNTGGILAMVIFKKLLLNANIDVSNKGFRGGAPEPDYTSGCRTASPDTFYFTPAQTHRAGGKGEGNIIASFPYTMGPGRAVTGGGGGLGYFGGGGGGGNYGDGGRGGRQLISCSVTTRASGGYNLGPNNYYGFDRISMGGGGGSSTEDATYSTTPGGDGGGMVIIMADTLNGNGYSIVSNGESITGTVLAGGAGGGAGGTVAMDVNVYQNSLNVEVNGGDGGNTGAQITGAGGGGGGGIFWCAGEVLPGAVSLSASGGNSGTAADVLYLGGGGSVGGSVTNLDLPLNGFLFNSINSVPEICANQVPDAIFASMPKGGEAGYTYKWLQSTDATNWSLIPSATDSLFYQPGPLTQTTYFTRVVESGAVSDTALEIEVFVYPAINGNNLAIRDTFCFSDGPGAITMPALTGGDNSFEYTWQTSTSQPSWSNAGSNPSLTQSSLNATTFYRRIVTSAGGICIDTSNIDTLTVLPSITGNQFLVNDTAICDGLDAGSIPIGNLSGGDGNYTIQWLQSTDNTNYSTIALANQPGYSPGILTDSTYYKRVVFSGADNACRDTTVPPYRIDVYPVLSNYNISIANQRLCAGDTLEQITGENPTGGDGNYYAYTWQWRYPGESWAEISGESDVNYNPETIVEDTFQIKRITSSGIGAECVSESNVLQVDVIPYITNNLTTLDENICEGAAPVPFTGEPAAGGNGGFTYLWQYQEQGSSTWPSASGSNNAINYTPGELTTTTLYRRSVNSEICTSYSDTITITVYPAIENNLISDGNIQYTCYNTSKQILATTPTGGKPDEAPRFNWQESLDSIAWSIAGGNDSIEDYTSPELIDTIFYRRIVLSGENDQCKDTTKAVLIRINPLPTGDIISNIDTACSGNVIEVDYNIAGNGPWSVSLGVSEPTFTQDGITAGSGTLNFPATESGDLKLLDLVDGNGCHADLTVNTEAIDLTVYEYPETFAGNDAEVCGTSYTLQAGQIGEIGLWTGTGNFAQPSVANTEVNIETFSQSVEYTFTWTELNWQCESEDEVTLTFYEQPEVPDLGEDIPLDYTFSYELNAPLPIGAGTWEVLSSPTTAQPSFADATAPSTLVTFPSFEYGEYELQWSVTNGVCPTVNDALIIEVGEKVLYTAFSPNDDGVNDLFTINLSGLSEATLIIYDRNGRKVYETTVVDAEQIQWDGRNESGVLMPVGTYFYVITEVENPEGTKKSYVELRK